MQQQGHITTTLTELRSLGYDSSKVTFTDVVAVMQGRINPMRDMDKESLLPNLSLTIKHVANLYGARVAVDSVTLRECMDLVQQEFSNLALTEIIQAYRLWAAQKFDALEMYGGQFNVTQFARVLAGYKTHRFEINQALARQKHKDEKGKREKEESERRKIHQENDFKAFPAAVANAKHTGRFPKVKNVPHGWYDLAMRHDMIHFEDGEKAYYWERAKKAAMADRLQNKAKDFVAALSVGDTKDERFKIAATYRAKQLIVFEKVLSRNATDPEPKSEKEPSGEWYDITTDSEYFKQEEE